MTIEIKEFIVRYIGDNPPTKDEVFDVLIDCEIDEGGIVETEERKPVVKICSACSGIGNVDESVGFQLDCGECGGSGYLKIIK